MFLESTTQHALEYRVAECARLGGIEWWVISPCTGQALGPFLDLGGAQEVCLLLNDSALPEALRRAGRYQP